MTQLCTTCGRELCEDSQVTPAVVLARAANMQSIIDHTEIGDDTSLLWAAFGALQSETWFLRALAEGRCVLCECKRQQEKSR